MDKLSIDADKCKGCGLCEAECGFNNAITVNNGKANYNNSGSCIRTRTGHSFQCQWTLSLDDGTIQVAGREFDQGTSQISITGGTGRYSGITGEMTSHNNNDGTFTQTLHYRIAE